MVSPPVPQTIFVVRLAPEIMQALAKVGDMHWRVRSKDQGGYKNNDGEAVEILTHA